MNGMKDDDNSQAGTESVNFISKELGVDQLQLNCSQLLAVSVLVFPDCPLYRVFGSFPNVILIIGRMDELEVGVRMPSPH